jgi:catechol 2,3-dioxygenase-like lactoylglutathione lyase family enzyme
MIRLAITNVYVDDQDKALAFYTEVLGFEKKNDIPLGEARWLTVVPPGQAGGVELLLEPNGNPIAQDYQAALREAGSRRTPSWPPTTSTPSTLGCPSLASPSPRTPPPWVAPSGPSSMTPAATSSFSSRWADAMSLGVLRRLQR